MVELNPFEGASNRTSVAVFVKNKPVNYPVTYQYWKKRASGRGSAIGFDTPYDENQAVLPLGNDPVLVTDVDATPLPNGRLRLSFNERLPGAKEPRSFQMELDPKLMQGMMHLLETALIKSQWQEPFSQA